MGPSQSSRVDAHARAGREGSCHRCRSRKAACRTHADRRRDSRLFAKYPKACMGGWGQRLMLINPSGKVLPCHAAEVLPQMSFENVRDKSLAWIWQESASFQRFRGEAWMPEPCRSCERRVHDFGGCRCQALLLAGDANATDPAC